MTRGTGSGQLKLWHARVAFFYLDRKEKMDQKQKGNKKISKISAAKKIKSRKESREN